MWLQRVLHLRLFAQRYTKPASDYYVAVKVDLLMILQHQKILIIRKLWYDIIF